MVATYISNIYFQHLLKFLLLCRCTGIEYAPHIKPSLAPMAAAHSRARDSMHFMHGLTICITFCPTGVSAIAVVPVKSVLKFTFVLATVLLCMDGI